MTWVATFEMTEENHELAATPTHRAVIAGRIVSTIAVLFLGFDAVVKLLRVPAAVQGTAQLGYPVSVIFTIGVIQAIALLLYIVPRTAAFGALIWTGYLGGAVATHVRIGTPLFTHVLSPVYVALFLWGGLWLRDDAVRTLLPFRRRSAR